MSKYCFTVLRNRIANPTSQGRKHIVPFSPDCLNSKTITGETKISYENLLRFLFTLPVETKVTCHTAPNSKRSDLESFTAELPDGQSIYIKLYVAEEPKTASLVFISLPGKPIVETYLQRNAKPSGDLVFIFKSRIMDPQKQVLDFLHRPETLPISHPFRVLSKKLYPEIIDFDLLFTILGFSFSKSGIIHKLSPSEQFNHAYLESLNGITFINFTQSTDFPETFEGNRIHSLIHIDFRIGSIIEQSNYIELDATFDYFKPYIVSVPLGIISNESFPLGFSMGPTENKILYSQFYECVKQYNLDIFQKMVSLALLSDMGSALKSLAKEYNIINHFYCYHHIIKSFGASTNLGKLVDTLLFKSYNKDEFLTFWREKEAIIYETLLSSNENHQKRFFKLFNCQFDEDQHRITEGWLDKQSMFERSFYSVATCSNHIESIHSKMNAKLKQNKKFFKRFDGLIQYFDDKIQKSQQRPNLKKIITEKIRAKDSFTEFEKRLYNYTGETEGVVFNDIPKFSIVRSEFSGATKFIPQEADDSWNFNENQSEDSKKSSSLEEMKNAKKKEITGMIQELKKRD